MPPTPTMPSMAIQIHGTPAMKNSAPQATAISMVWPKSGSATRSAATSASRIRAKTLPGMSERREFSANSQAQITTKAGFMNSEGCSDMPSDVDPAPRAVVLDADEQHREHQHQRDASTTSAVRRACRGVRNEVPIITTSAGRKKKRWRLTKW